MNNYKSIDNNIKMSIKIYGWGTLYITDHSVFCVFMYSFCISYENSRRRSIDKHNVGYVYEALTFVDDKYQSIL